MRQAPKGFSLEELKERSKRKVKGGWNRFILKARKTTRRGGVELCVSKLLLLRSRTVLRFRV